MSSSPDTNLINDKPVISLEYVDLGVTSRALSAALASQTVQRSGAKYTEEEVAQLVAKARAEATSESLARACAEQEATLAKSQMQMAQAVVQFKKERDDYYGRVEAELVNLALGIAGRILHREAQVDRMLLAALARVAIENLQQRSRVVVRTRPENCRSWREYFDAHLSGCHVEIVEDSQLSEGGCVLETDLGTADVSLDAQLKEVEHGLFDLLAQRPEN